MQWISTTGKENRRRVSRILRWAAGQPRLRTYDRLRRPWGQHRRRPNHVLRWLSPTDCHRMANHSKTATRQPRRRTKEGL